LEWNSKENIKNGLGLILEKFIELHIQRAKRSRKHKAWQAASQQFQSAIQLLVLLLPSPDIATSIIEDLKLHYLTWLLDALNTSQSTVPELDDLSKSEESDSSNEGESKYKKNSKQNIKQKQPNKTFLTSKQFEEATDFILKSVNVSNEIIFPSWKIYLKVIEIQNILNRKLLEFAGDEKHDDPRIKSILEKAVTLYGKQSPEVWLKYVSYLMELGDIAQASRVHWKAMKTLKLSKHVEYVGVYNEQQFHPFQTSVQK